MRNVKISAWLVLLFCLSANTGAQVVSGPMLGQVELRTAKVWIEVKPGTAVDIWYWKKGNMAGAQKLSENTSSSAWFAPLTFDLVALDMNTTYEYQFLVNNKSAKKPTSADGEFTTKDLWQWRKPAPDFSFLTGSCAYFNEPIYDRPGKPYGGDSTIFETMAKEKSAFTVWLGDNWYTREADYFSDWGLWYRVSHDRSLPILKNLWKSMPHYAIWDDHDYGPNDGDKSFALKETSRKIFTSYWCNPSYGENGQGIYSRISYSDADFFLMDDRYFRSSDAMSPYVYNKPNPDKRMWGAKQMDWIKNALLNSKAVFKFIVTGSQTLNPVSPYDCLQEYPVEFNDLMGFLTAEKISGVIFLTGDRHHSEVIRYERNGNYPLYDVTSSPFTSGVSKVSGVETNNPYRVANTLVEAQNYSRVTITGNKDDRKLTVEFVGIKGEKLASWSVGEKELK
jgi:alkaline phosphatase D